MSDFPELPQDDSSTPITEIEGDNSAVEESVEIPSVTLSEHEPVLPVSSTEIAALEETPVENKPEVDDESTNFQEVKLEQFRSVQGIIEEEQDMAHLLETAGLREIALLMEVIASSSVQEVKDRIPKVAQIKRSFDKKKQEEADLTKAITDEEKRRAEQDKHNEVSRSFSASLAKFNATKTEHERILEAEKSENTHKKEALLAALKEIVANEDLGRDAAVRDIQQQWKEIGYVTNEKSEDIIQTYKALLDQFYTLRKRHKDLEDIDRQRNLEDKENLIKEVLTLIPENATEVGGIYWRENSEKVKNIHEIWKLIGPVPSGISEDIWARFKKATDNFYDIRKEYYVQQDSLRLENAKIKQDIMAQLVEAIKFDYQTVDEWKQATERIYEIQKSWMAVGQTPLEVSGQLWKEYREFCNKFFAAKSAFFDALDTVRKEHLNQKFAIIEQVEALQESTDWRKTAELIQQLQQQWKTIPYHSHKEADKLWKRFRKACDTFFKRKGEHFESARKTETENLAKKEEICKRVEGFLQESPLEDHIEEIKELQAQWKEIGLVPIKEKEPIWQRFRKACDEYFENFHKQKRSSGKTNPKFNRQRDDYALSQRGNPKQLSEERKVKDKIRIVQEKITQYENNILFIAKGSAGDKLREIINSQIEQTKKELTLLTQELKNLHTTNDTTPENTPATPPVVDSPVTDTE